MVRKRPRPRLKLPDKLFWALLCRLWSGWKQAILIVQPETVIRWHRAGFKLYWKWISRRRTSAGLRPTSKELRELIFQMVVENPTWGAPRIHGELKMLGFEISERIVLNWMRRLLEIPIPQSGGRHFWPTTVKRLRLWISSRFRRSPLACSTASSLLPTVGVKFCISTSRDMQPAHGCRSNYAKCFHMIPRLVT